MSTSVDTACIYTTSLTYILISLLTLKQALLQASCIHLLKSTVQTAYNPNHKPIIIVNMYTFLLALTINST